MIRRNRSHREILGRLWDRLEAVPNEQGWPASGEWPRRRVPDEPRGILDALAEEFGPERLVESGVADRQGDGPPTISSRLAPGATTLFALWEDEGAMPFDALLPDGLLLGEEPPACAVAHDWRAVAAMRSSDGLLLLVPTMEDVAYGLGLGQVTVPLAGIDRLDLAGLRQIEALTRASSPPPLPCPEEPAAGAERVPVNGNTSPDAPRQDTPETDAAQHAGVGQQAPEEPPPEDGVDVIATPAGAFPVELVIAGWSFARRQPVPEEELRRLISRLADAQRFLRIDLSGVAVWIPSQADVDRIQVCCELGDRDALRDAVLESIHGACYELSAVASGDIAPWQTPGTYLDARSALWRVLRRPDSAPASHCELIETFDHQLQRQVIGPLIAAGVSHADPIHGVLHIAFAETTHLLQSQAPFLQRDLIEAGIQADPRARPGTLESGLRCHLQLIDRLVRIARELRQ